MTFDYTGKLGDDGFFKHEDDVHAWCKAMGISYYTYAYSNFHQAMALSLNHGMNLSERLEQLSQLPVRFDSLQGSLWLQDNQLTSLAGLPLTCQGIHLYNNPLSFEYLMPLSKIQKIKLIHLPIELNNELEKKGVEFKIEYDNFIVIEEKSLLDFQAMLTKIEQSELLKKQQALLAENKDAFLSLNKAFQRKNKTLFKGQSHEV